MLIFTHLQKVGRVLFHLYIKRPQESSSHGFTLYLNFLEARNQLSGKFLEKIFLSENPAESSDFHIFLYFSIDGSDERCKEKKYNEK